MSTLNNIKHVALPLGLMFTILPIYGVSLHFLAQKYGPASIVILLFLIGVSALVLCVGIEIYQRRKKAEEAKTKTCKCGAVTTTISSGLEI